MPYYSELGIYTSPTSTYTGSGSYIVGPYSNHSSLLPSNFSRPPPILLKPRKYKPHLATITENQSGLRRIDSPKLRVHISPKVVVPKPIKINTADIDVSVNKYRKYERSPKPSSEDKAERKSPSPSNKTETPISPRSSVEAKEATPTKIRRDRPTVRLRTIHQDLVPAEIKKTIRSWRDNFEPQELIDTSKEEEKKPRKTPGELLKEKFLIRSREDIHKSPEKKIGKRASKKAATQSQVQKTPSFHDICQAITTDQIFEDLNPGQPLEIQRRQSRQISTEEIIKELKRNSTDLSKEIDHIMNQRNNEISEAVFEKNEDNNYDSRGSVKRRKKLTKKKSNEKLILSPSTPDPESNKSGLQRRPTQKKIRRTSTDSSITSIGSEVVDAETEKAYQGAIRDISQVEIEEIKVKPKPIVTATVDVEEKPTLRPVVDDVEVVESPKPKRTNKFKFNVIVEEIEEARRKSTKKFDKGKEQNGTVHIPKSSEPVVSNLLKHKQNAHMGQILEDAEIPRKDSLPETINNQKDGPVSNKVTEEKKYESIKNAEAAKQTDKSVVDKLAEVKPATLNKTSSIDKDSENVPKTALQNKIKEEKKPAEMSKTQDEQATEKKPLVTSQIETAQNKNISEVNETVDKKVSSINAEKTKLPETKIDKKEDEQVVEKQTEESKAALVKDNKIEKTQQALKKDEVMPAQKIESVNKTPKEEPKSMIQNKSANENKSTLFKKTSSTEKVEQKEEIKTVPPLPQKKLEENKPETVLKKEEVKTVSQNKVEEERPDAVLKKEEIKAVPQSKVEEKKSEPVLKKEEIKKSVSIEKISSKDENQTTKKTISSQEKVTLTKSKSEHVVPKKEEEIKKTSSNDEITTLKSSTDQNKIAPLKKETDKNTTIKKPESPLSPKLKDIKKTDILQTKKVTEPEKKKATKDIGAKPEEKEEDEEINFWDAIGPRESIYRAPKKMKPITPPPATPPPLSPPPKTPTLPTSPKTPLSPTPLPETPPPKTPKPPTPPPATPPPKTPTSPTPPKTPLSPTSPPATPTPKTPKSPTPPPTTQPPKSPTPPPVTPPPKSFTPPSATSPPKTPTSTTPPPAAENAAEKKEETVQNEADETIPKKLGPSKRSLVNKANKDDPDLEVFIPPEPEPKPEPEPEPEPQSSFVPLQSNRLSQFMNPFKKPEQYDECPVEIWATPKTIRKRHYPKPRHPVPAPVEESESSDEEESEEETSSSEESSSDDEYDTHTTYGNNKVGASTSSNDSGFDSGVPGSRNKDCDVNCHKKCEKLTANLCGVNQKLVVEAIESVRKGSSESRDSPTSNPANNPALALDSGENLEEYSQSSTFAGFQKSGRITPPATTIPRFRKYSVDDFNFLKVLGKGSFGKVLLAELKNTEYYYAIKCLKKDVVLEDDDVECTLIERKVLALATKHPYLCHLLCTFQTESHLFFVMEYLNGGDLMFHIQQSGRFPEVRARFYGAEIVSGLKFLHNKGIVYRDLKLDNILLDFDGHVRIADFGMCKLQIFLDRMADTFCGTPDYMAPEIIKGQHYNQCVDWWSFGVLLYEMLIGQSPFSGCDEDELFWSICNEKPVIPRFLSAEASQILVAFLEKDANKRLGNRFCPKGDIQDQPFFKPIRWDLLEARLLEPPFKPNLQHPLDTQYFDRTFTVEKAKLTPIEQNILQSMDQTQFQGFSYTNPNATDK